MINEFANFNVRLEIIMRSRLLMRLRTALVSSSSRELCMSMSRTRSSRLRLLRESRE